MNHSPARFGFFAPKSWPYFFGLILVTVLLLTAWWLLFPSDDGTLAEIQRRGTLRVGLDASFPPFEVINESGQIVGLDVDIAQVIASDLGVELEVVNIGFDGLYDALLARRVDLVISGLPYDPRWTEDVAYTNNYFNAGQVLLTPVEETTIEAAEDLSDHTIAIEWGSQADMEARRLAQDIPTLTLLRQPTAEEAIQSVRNGQADVAIVDGVSGLNATSSGLKTVTYLTDEWYAAAVHIESQALLEAVNQTLVNLEESGRMDQLQAEWLQAE